MQDAKIFNETPDTVAVTSAFITRKERPILLVSHYPGEDGWAFLTGGTFSVEESQLVAIKTIIAIDPTVTEVADLPPGWSAERETVGGEWRRYADCELELTSLN
ncbi:MAG: hypothetical protein K2Y39_03380 [Candidatus Obscuribacterales bacterium]|nr:hypothetical protein [Candidatus Obscuribacterales bacterium]